jgi:hypothetical protein
MLLRDVQQVVAKIKLSWEVTVGNKDGQRDRKTTKLAMEEEEWLRGGWSIS